jgi:serine/threonine protein kinase
MAGVSGRAGQDDDAEPGTGDGGSVDSFLREVARAPTGRTAPPSVVPGSVVAGRFRLERRLGEGGMGVVWAATHAVTRKPVALKFLKRAEHDDRRAVQRFLREARAACAVRHPSVVEIHDVLELDDGSPVMVMELLSGETLAQRLERDRTVPLPELARIMVHVCSALGCAHSLGIVHRDLKPENIFLVQSTARIDVKVLDFGIAKLTASEGDAAQSGAMTATGAILGTPYYMAPEQLFGEKDVDHRADIWALGIIFYEALSGSRPTQAENVGQIYKVITTDAMRPLRETAPHLPEPILDLVSRMLERDRARRPVDVREVLGVLSRYTNESFVWVDPPSAMLRADSATALPHVDSDTARASTTPARPVVTSERAGSKRRGIRFALGAFGAAGVMAGAFALREWSRTGVQSAEPPKPSPTAAAEAAPPLETPTPPMAVEPPAVPAPSTRPPAPPKVATSMPPGPTKPSPPPSVPPAPPAAVMAPASASAPAASAVAKPAINCTPDYYFDMSGNKHFKPECFER